MGRTDTSREANKVLVSLYRQMPPAVKVARIFGAYQTGKLLAMAGLRDRYPQADEQQIWRLWAQQHLGEKLFNEVYGKMADE